MILLSVEVWHAQNNAKIRLMNVLSIFCTKIQVFFIRILPKIEFQNFHAFFSTESLFTFSTFQSSQVIQEVCLHILNKSLGLDKKNSFLTLLLELSSTSRAVKYGFGHLVIKSDKKCGPFHESKHSANSEIFDSQVGMTVRFISVGTCLYRL